VRLYITRLAKADCGSGKWGQSFSFDVFGNITKANLSGRTGIKFQPTYAAATNRYQTLPGGTPAYDSNGNVTNDSFHTYAWDSDANVTTLDSATTLTYDALDRRVEQATSGVYTQTLYGPGGTKLALVNGATVSKVFTPLSGGATAIYTSSGLAYYRHPDWLGSSRLASAPSRTVYYDGAYAPYGENYAESGTTDRNFTGQNQDTATDLYDFLYREYHPTQGRWIQPDPAGLSAVDPTNPQSWNRYGYVANSPLASADENGLCSGDNGVYYDDNNHGTVWFSGPCSGGPIGTDPDTVDVNGLFGPVSGGNQQPATSGGDGGGGGSRQPAAPSNSISQTPYPPNTPKTTNQCSIYNNGTASGTALYTLCSKVFPNGPWSNKMRGCLQSLYSPQSGYLPLSVIVPPTVPGCGTDLNNLLPGTGAHIACALESSGFN